MAYSENLANRLREILEDVPQIAEKAMFGGLCFMVNDKMCVGIIGDELMCRIDPEKQEELLEKTGCRIMDFTKKPMKGYLMVDDSGMRNRQELAFWVQLALEFNPKAKSSKKKK